MKIFIKPENLEWDSRVENMLARTEGGKQVIIPKNEITCQNHGEIQGWEVKEMAKNGIYCVPLEERDGVVIASRAEAMKEDFNKLELWEKYTFRIQGITPWGIFVTPLESDLVCLVHFKEVSRARLKDMRLFFNVGETIEAMVSEKNKELYQVSLNRKDLYPTLNEVGYRYEKNQILSVMVTQRVNQDGYFCEINPGIPGIISGRPEKLDKLIPGQKVLTRVVRVKPEKGLCLHLIDS